MPRTYRSPVRDQGAAQTRQRIAAAALELFAEHGFVAATVDAIAGRAGVAPQTVYAAYGSKTAIVAALLAQMEANADAPGWRARIAAKTDPRERLAAFAAWTGALFESSRRVILAARGAVGDPAMVALLEHGNEHRRAALRELIGGLSASGALRADLALDRAVDRAWMLTGVELYLAAVQGCGWLEIDYVAWLTDLLQRELLAPTAEAGPT